MYFPCVLTPPICYKWVIEKYMCVKWCYCYRGRRSCGLHHADLRQYTKFSWNLQLYCSYNPLHEVEDRRHIGLTLSVCPSVCKWNRTRSTVYPKKYAHGFCFAVLCCGYTLTDFPISTRLTSLALWQSNDCLSASKATLMNMDKYFMWIHYERLHNHNKAKHNKTVCIFLYTVLCCVGSASWIVHIALILKRCNVYFLDIFKFTTATS